MIRLTRELPVVFGMLCALAANASGAELNGGIREVPAEPYGGMVVNQTITVIGRSFYDHFVAAWREFPLTDRYAIAIHEWPSARWGSRVRVEYAQRPVYQAFLQPTRANLKAIGEQAAEITYRNTVDTEVQRLFFRDPDIGPDEI